MNGLHLTLWVGAAALVLWNWRREVVRANRAHGPAGDVTTAPVTTYTQSKDRSRRGPDPASARTRRHR